VTEPDLFVVCKNCSSEVSPYVTECPYCGQRVRKRAPKIERREDPDDAARRRVRRGRPTLPRLRPDEIEGIAPDTRPYATGLLVALSLLATVAIAGGLDLIGKATVVPGLDDEAWRWVTAPFLHSNLGYQFIVLVAVGIFGMLIERRFGPVATVVIFLAAGVAGCAAAVGADLPPPFDSGSGYRVDGANAAALGLLAAWLVDARRAMRRGHDRDSDLIGVYVSAAVLVLVPVAVEEASLVAGVAGAATGAVLGLGLPIFTRR
jgi:membrane associated rhomboid family serine protease